MGHLFACGHNVPHRSVVQQRRRHAAGNHRSARGSAVSSSPLLVVEGLCVDLVTPRGMLLPVDAVDLAISASQAIGVVGESGSGKTMLSRAILQILPRKALLSGRILFDGYELTRLDRWALRRLRGRSIAGVF